MNKLGLSQVVTIVLIIAIVIVAVTAFSFYVLPFTNSLLGKEDCFAYLNNLNFEEDSSFNCWVDDVNKERTGFSIKITSDELEGFKVGLVKYGNTETIDVTQGVISDSLRMLHGSFNEELEVNLKGGIRTYVAKGIYNLVEIYPILAGGKVCGEAKRSLEPSSCLDPLALENLIDDDDGQNPICGNNILENEEVCDGTDLDGESCASQGFDDGTLVCNPDCLGFDIGGCNLQPTCELTNAYWEPPLNVNEGTVVELVVEGNNCYGEEIGFEIWEADTLSGDDGVLINPAISLFDVGEFRAQWNSEWQDDWDILPSDPEYYFIATLLGNGAEYASTNQLEVTQASPECGNGFIQTGEDCDDGNLDNGDGCDSNCQIEIFGDEEICNNGIEDDGDGYVDCDDVDCDSHPDCFNIGDPGDSEPSDPA